MPRRYREEEATNPYARRMAILDILFSANNEVRTGDLVSRFRIPANLLAYDLRQLEEMGLVERGYGWVRRRIAAIEDLFAGSEYAARMDRAREAKERIARQIVESLIQPGSQVALDAGSTAALVGRFLVELKKEVTLWTNNLPLFLYVMVHSDMVCHLAGGTLNRAHAALVGDVPARQFSETKFDLAVVTPKGLNIQDMERARRGPFGHELDEATRTLAMSESEAGVCLTLFNEDQSQDGYKRTLVRNANQVILAADKGKLAAVGRPCLLLASVPGALMPQEPAPTLESSMLAGWPVAGSRGGAIPEALLRLLDSSHDDVRAAAAEAIGQLGVSGSVAALTRVLRDPSHRVRLAAQEALARAGESLPGQCNVVVRAASEVQLVTDAGVGEVGQRNPELPPEELEAWASHGLTTCS